MLHLCEECNKPIRPNDEIVARVLTRYQALKSKVVYALERPTECFGMSHKGCVFHEDDDEK
jgi:hypothetical protein